jgi:hypothetical protein
MTCVLNWELLRSVFWSHDCQPFPLPAPPEKKKILNPVDAKKRTSAFCSHWITHLSIVAVKLDKSEKAVTLLTCIGEVPGSKPRLLTYFFMLLHRCIQANLRIVFEIGHGHFHVGLEILIIDTSIFWDIRPLSPLKVNRRFGATCRLQFHGRKLSQESNQPFWRPHCFLSCSYKIDVNCFRRGKVAGAWS